MKNIIIIAFILFSVAVLGQTQTENYIKSTSYKAESASVIPNPTLSQATENITYFDGLGRPVQKVAYRQSGSGKDVVTPIEYDSFGRIVKDYLSYVPTTAASLDYKTGALTDINPFYNTVKYQNTLNPYSQKAFEASPLNRVLRQAAPGNDWKMGGGHELKFDYQTNSGSAVNQDQVKKFSANIVNVNNTYSTTLVQNGYYNANDLFKMVTYDENTANSPSENNGSAIEFKNKQGQVILKRTYGTTGANAVSERFDTYYVYDDFGNLSFVIPPKASDLIFTNTSTQADLTSTDVILSGNELNLSASNSITLLSGFNAKSGSTFTAKIQIGDDTILNNLCYQYKYDSRNRLIEKKLPGKQWEFIVYDNLNRIVATGPANSPFDNTVAGAAGWNITKYDAFDRPIITGWMPAASINSTERKNLQDARNAETVNFSETKTSSTITTINNVDTRYTNLVWPNNSSTAPISTYYILSIKYYDNYDYPGAPTAFNNVAQQPVYYNASVKPKGLLTGSWTRILEATTAPIKGELSYTLYDRKARPIRTNTSNYLGGYNQIDTNFDFSGKTIYTITEHQRAVNESVISIKDEYSYTAQDRLESVKQTISNNTQFLAFYIYDELGQLVSKKVGNTQAAPLQIVDYTYNVRGWLKGINNVNQLITGTDPKDLFAFQVNYNDITDTSKRLYNGNISQTIWSSDNTDKSVRNYTYSYDLLNRLKSAVDNSGFFNEDNIQYDKNGNILKLQRTGALVPSPSTSIPTNYGQMDNLSYFYDSGNKLMKVTDDAPIDQYGFKDDAVNGAADTADDYSYDINGNMLTDANKGITNISYNHLNLPVKIILSTGNITYLYNAVGQKVKKTVVETSSANTTITEYLNGFQYKKVNSQATELQYFPTKEGYVANKAGSYSYVFQYKDHLGNIRLSYAKNISSGLTDIIEENNYYPFGLEHQGYNNNPNPTYGNVVSEQYKYNGKELQDELGLNVYDYGARNYMPDIGRWGSIDNKSEKFISLSPYHYAGNNPILYLDVDGNEFTEDAWKWVNRLIAEINSRQASNNQSIKNAEETIASGKYGWFQSEKSLKNKIARLKSENTELETTRGETAVLASSSQVYDVVNNSSNTERDMLGTSTTTNQTTFNSDNNRVQLTVSSGTDLGLFSHELKHMYQFEKGETTLGLTKNNGGINLSGGKLLFYDLSDEVQAYQRGAMFGQKENINSTADVLAKGIYSDKIPSGPINSVNHPNAAAIKQDPQSFADKHNAAFRIGITTYKPK